MAIAGLQDAFRRLEGRLAEVEKGRIAVTPRVRSMLDQVAAETGEAPESAMRKGLAIYLRAMKAAREGQKLVVIDADDNIVGEITDLDAPLPGEAP